MPLDIVASDIRSRTGAEIIDVQLFSVGDSLIYVVKTLTATGQVVTQNYSAQSGLPIEAQ